MKYFFKYFFILSISSLFSTVGQAQIGKLDSQRVNKTFEDIMKIGKTKNANPQSVLLLWDSIALFCKKINWREHEVAAYSNATNYATSLNRPDIHYQYLQKFEHAFNENNYLLGEHYEKHAQKLMQSKAFYFYFVGNHKTALTLFKTHLDYLKKKALKANVQLMPHYYNVASEEFILGNYQNTIDIYSEAIKIQQQDSNMNFRLILQFNINLGELYTKIKNFDQAFLHYEKAFDAKKKLEKQPIQDKDIAQTYILLYHSLADYYTQKQLYGKAIAMLDISLNYQKPTSPLWGSTMQKLGVAYSETPEIDKALHFLQNALSTAQKKYMRHYELAQIYMSFARFYDKKQDYAAALHQTQQALIALSEQFNIQDINSTPSVSEVYNKRYLLEVLDLKADLLLKASNKQANYLDIAYKTSQEAESLIDIIRADCTSDFDKQYLSDFCYPVYEKSVRIASQLYERNKTETYLVSVYNSIEKNKATILLESLKNTQAEMQLNEPDRNRLYQLRAETHNLEDSLYREKNERHKTLADSTVIAYQERLRTVKQEFDVFIKKLEIQYPNYYKLKFGKLTRNIAEVQQALTSSDLLLDYFMTEDAVYTITLTANDKQLFKFKKDKNFDKTLANLRQFIAVRTSDDAQTFADLSFKLYENLLQTPLSNTAVVGSIFPKGFLWHKPKRLIIIPDGLLNYIPFEAFVTSNQIKKPSFLSLPYLIKDYTCTYAYSAAAYCEQKYFKKQQAQKLFAGFAPTYNYDSTSDIALRTGKRALQNLPGALNEVNYAAKLFNGDIFKDDRATEQIFRESAQDYRILHFGMHSLLNDKSPLLSNLIFTQNKKDSTINNQLTINELYGLHLNADLAVLSACNTGMGDINRGEGVISLSRAFTFIGVPATMMSLWEVEDFSSADIIPRLYDNLKNGQSKDEALKNAKLLYLQKVKTEAEAHPYYWAGLIGIGNTDAIDCSTPFPIFSGCSISISTVLGSLSALFGSFLFLKKRYKTPTV